MTSERFSGVKTSMGRVKTWRRKIQAKTLRVELRAGQARCHLRDETQGDALGCRLSPRWGWRRCYRVLLLRANADSVSSLQVFN